jgi:hypothetical protein
MRKRPQKKTYFSTEKLAHPFLIFDSREFSNNKMTSQAEYKEKINIGFLDMKLKFRSFLESQKLSLSFLIQAKKE